jgi:hypothetical protein
VRYEALIYTATVGLGIAYSAAALHPDIYHAVREHVLPPETLTGAMACLGLAGAALGMFLTLALAPRAFLESASGGRWVRALGFGSDTASFRLSMLCCASVGLLMSYTLVRVAFWP